MKISGLFLFLAGVLYSCSGESTVTERFKQVHTKELILQGENGKWYTIRVDSLGKLKAIPLSEKENE